MSHGMELWVKIGAATDNQRGDRKVIAFPENRARRSGASPKVQADAEMRIVLVEWRIKKGCEQVFLDYWSVRATLEERSGLIGEFLNRVESSSQFPWITWDLNDAWTTFVNVGLWRNAMAFQEQIGCKLDESEPKLAFEHEPRRRIFLGPERWRIGGTLLPDWDHAQVS